jgi:hypothetical protein
MGCSNASGAAARLEIRRSARAAFGPGNLVRAGGVVDDVSLRKSAVLASLLRLLVLRPLLTLAIFGIPLIVLVAVGLFAILAVKILLFVVLPIALIVWVARRIMRSGDTPAS